MATGKSGERRRKVNKTVNGAVVEALEGRILMSAVAPTPPQASAVVPNTNPVATWTGADNNALWTDPGNWVGDLLPTSGESVDFPANGTHQYAPAIDLNGNQTVGDVTFEGYYEIYSYSNNQLIVDGNITFTSSSAYLSDDVVTLTHNTTITVTGTGTPSFQTIGDNGNGYGITKEGTGSFSTAGTYSGPTEVAQGTLSLSDPATSITVDSGATLEGYGGDAGITDNGGTLGLGTGTDTGSLTLGAGSTYQQEVDGYETYEFDSTLTVTGPSINLTGSALDVVTAEGFTPAVGHVITVLANQTGSAITGTFAGLPQGAITTSGGVDYQVSYVGGTGHDVTLTVVLPADVWNGMAGDNNWSTAANWVGAVAPVSGQPVDFPDLGAAASITLSSPVTVGNISIEGQYTFSGDSITAQGSITSSNTGTDIQSDLILAQNTTVTVNPSDNLTLANVSSGSNAYGLTEQGSGTLILPRSGTSTYTGTTTIAQGTFQDDQALDSAVTVDSGGTFEGSGTANGITSVGGTIALGDGPAAPSVLTTSGNVSFDSATTLEEVLGMTSGTETDGELAPQGTSVNLGGATLDILMPGGFTSSTGHTITLISNQTGQPVTGTFDGLPEGAIQTFDGIQYQISYAGGQSNRDVTLTDVTPVASRLVFAQQPGNAVAGAGIGTVVVNVVDGDGDVITTDDSTVSLSCGTAITGTTSVAAVNGVATFTGLSIAQAGAYTLSAADGSLAPATSHSLTITPAAASALVIIHQPSATLAAGDSLGTVAVQVEDAYGNVVVGNSSSVTIAAQSTAAGTTGSVLTGTTTVAAQNGVAVFSNLVISASGTYTLTASAAGLTPAVTALVVVTAPANLATAGKPIVPLVVDPATAFPQASSQSKWLEVRVESAADGATVRSRRIRVKEGQAVLKNLKLRQAGLYNVVISDNAGQSTTEQLTVVASAPARLAFVTHPAVLNGNTPIAVRVLDAYGNPTTADDGQTVTLHLGWSDLLDERPPLTGTVTATIVDGVATFTNVSAARIGGAALVARSSKLLAARTRAVRD